VSPVVCSTVAGGLPASVSKSSPVAEWFVSGPRQVKTTESPW
jgi:hypothetical protein